VAAPVPPLVAEGPAVRVAPPALPPLAAAVATELPPVALDEPATPAGPVMAVMASPPAPATGTAAPPAPPSPPETARTIGATVSMSMSLPPLSPDTAVTSTLAPELAKLEAAPADVASPVSPLELTGASGLWGATGTAPEMAVPRRPL